MARPTLGFGFDLQSELHGGVEEFCDLDEVLLDESPGRQGRRSWTSRAELVTKKRTLSTSSLCHVNLTAIGFKTERRIAPILMPPGTIAETSPGTVFLLAAMWTSSRTFSTRDPSIPWRRSTRAHRKSKAWPVTKRAIQRVAMGAGTGAGAGDGDADGSPTPPRKKE